MTGEPDAGEGGRRRACADDPRYRLATYGTLAPGRPNHHQLDGLEGRWSRGHVRGRLVDAGWGASFGYPALVLEPEGPAVEVAVFESADLPAHWSRIDEFEGPGYVRVPTTVRIAQGQIQAFIYVVEFQPDGS
ncbi:MAG TPA: gamma-glutamylcyclotransferase [Mycobacteriales bacterium]